MPVAPRRVREAAADCSSLIGLTESELTAILGPPSSRTDVGDDAWLIFALPDVALRLRCSRAGDTLRCASWTAVFPAGFRSLSAAAAAVGLWPQVQPDENAGEVGVPLIRRRLDGPDRGLGQSFTASIRGGLIISVSAFDEPPDWM